MSKVVAAMLSAGSPWELLLCPAVWLLPQVRRGPGAVPAQVDVRLAAVLHWAAVHSLVDQAGHVRHAEVGGELVDPGGVPSLAGSASTTVDDGLRGESQVGELVAACDLKPEDGRRVTAVSPALPWVSPVCQSRESSLRPTGAAAEKLKYHF